MSKYLNDNFVSTYMKVGAFRIVNGNKVGGNVASYFCLPDGTVVHAIAGQVPANKLRSEAMWAVDVRKSAQVFAANLNKDKIDTTKFAAYLRKAHGERYHDEHREMWGDRATIPATMPRVATQPAKTHWLLAKNSGQRMERIYPVVWREILGEQLSDLPVDKR